MSTRYNPIRRAFRIELNQEPIVGIHFPGCSDSMNKVSRPMQFLGGRHRAAVLWNTAVVALGLMSLCPASALSGAAMAPGGEGQESMPGLLKLGVTVNGPKAFQGYTLVFPFSSTKTYLIDMQGKVVRKWDSKYTPGEVAFLEENGHLLRAAKLSDSEAISKFVCVLTRR